MDSPILPSTITYDYPRRSLLAHSDRARDYFNKNEKALGETQTLRAGCSKAEQKIFAPPQTRCVYSREHRTTKI